MLFAGGGIHDGWSKVSMARLPKWRRRRSYSVAIGSATREVHWVVVKIISQSGRTAENHIWSTLERVFLGGKKTTSISTRSFQSSLEEGDGRSVGWFELVDMLFDKVNAIQNFSRASAIHEHNIYPEMSQKSPKMMPKGIKRWKRKFCKSFHYSEVKILQCWTQKM